MIRCSQCGTAHPLNTLYCDECGARLADIPAADGVPSRPGRTGESIGPPLPIRLYSQDEASEFRLVLNDTLLIGRADRAIAIAPDIDLSALEGVRLGVSRRHARLLRTRDGVWLEDLNSSNGTYVGEQRLTPAQRVAVNSGDQLRFGKIALLISF
jgi:pSer/pThr/pTyr-binding forkhead associated (FHA) protein